MKIKRIVYINAMLLILWMIVIFGFSAQPVRESVDLSERVGRKISELFIPGFREMPSEQQDEFVEDINLGVRKTAHFLEYMVLGICWMFFLFQMGIPDKVRIWTGIAACVVFAAGDEFHQLFVDGRSARWQDVCIDSTGALLGILISVFLLKIRRRKHTLKICHKAEETGEQQGTAGE